MGVSEAANPNTSTSPPVQKPIAGTNRVGLTNKTIKVRNGDFAGKRVTVKPWWWGNTPYVTNPVTKAVIDGQRAGAAVVFEVASILAPVPKIGLLAKGYRFLRGAKAAERLTQGTNVVYRGFNSAGKVKYVGITSRNPIVRFGEHLNAIGTGKELLRYEVIPAATKLSRIGARVYEQKLIIRYGLQKNGGQLLNKINSISPKKWVLYGVK